MKLSKHPKLAKLRKVDRFKYTALAWTYITAFTSTWCISEYTDNPWLFFFLYMAGLLMMHNAAHYSGYEAAHDEIRLTFNETNAEFEKLMKASNLMFHVKVTEKESTPDKPPPDNVVKFH